MSFHVRGTLTKIALCRSGEYGYAKMACTACGFEEWRARGCGLRHCPTCGRARAEEWMEERKLELLECPYFQLVFSLPPALSPLARTNPTRIYGLFFDAVRDTLVELAKDPAHLGGIPQLLLALHTWNGRLDYFVHIHVLMAGGVYDPERDCWIPSKHPDFLFPVQVLSKLVRGKFLAELKRRWANGLLDLDPTPVAHLKDSVTWGRFIDELYETAFYSYVEKAVAGPELVVEYLGQYLQRVGLSNWRILSVKDGQVTFLAKDRKKKHSTTGYDPRTVSLQEFVDLFAQHILPRGFHRVRFGGLWSGRYKKLLPQAQAAVRRWNDEHPAEASKLPRHTPKPRAPELCPACQKQPLEHTDSLILAPSWWGFLWSCQPRGPPRVAQRRGRPA